MRKERRDELTGCVFAGVVLAVVAAVMVYPVFVRPGWGHRSSDLSNIKQLSLGFIFYSADWDDHLPLAERWFDQVNDTYIKNEQVGRCVGLPEGVEGYGHALNQALAGTSFDAMQHPERTILVFDSIDLSRNAVGDLSQLPNPGRNQGANAIGYADGGAKMAAIGEHF